MTPQPHDLTFPKGTPVVEAHRAILESAGVEWRDPKVPTIRSREDSIALARRELDRAEARVRDAGNPLGLPLLHIPEDAT